MGNQPHRPANLAEPVVLRTAGVRRPRSATPEDSVNGGDESVAVADSETPPVQVERSWEANRRHSARGVGAGEEGAQSARATSQTESTQCDVAGGSQNGDAVDPAAGTFDDSQAAAAATDVVQTLPYSCVTVVAGEWAAVEDAMLVAGAGALHPWCPACEPFPVDVPHVAVSACRKVTSRTRHPPRGTMCRLLDDDASEIGGYLKLWRQTFARLRPPAPRAPCCADPIRRCPAGTLARWASKFEQTPCPPLVQRGPTNGAVILEAPTARAARSAAAFAATLCQGVPSGAAAAAAAAPPIVVLCPKGIAAAEPTFRGCPGVRAMLVGVERPESGDGDPIMHALANAHGVLGLNLGASYFAVADGADSDASMLALVAAACGARIIAVDAPQALNFGTLVQASAELADTGAEGADAPTDDDQPAPPLAVPAAAELIPGMFRFFRTIVQHPAGHDTTVTLPGSVNRTVGSGTPAPLFDPSRVLVRVAVAPLPHPNHVLLQNGFSVDAIAGGRAMLRLQQLHLPSRVTIDGARAAGRIDVDVESARGAVRVCVTVDANWGLEQYNCKAHPTCRKCRCVAAAYLLLTEDAMHPSPFASLRRNARAAPVAVPAAAETSPHDHHVDPTMADIARFIRDAQSASSHQ